MVIIVISCKGFGPHVCLKLFFRPLTDFVVRRFEIMHRSRCKTNDLWHLSLVSFVLVEEALAAYIGIAKQGIMETLLGWLPNL